MAAAIVWSIVGAAGPARATTPAAGLDAAVTATWNGIGLREWAERVSETAGLPVLVDRRLDPDIALRLDCRDEPLRDVIARAAVAAGGEVATLRSSVRIVPRGRADVVGLAERARDSRLASLPARQRFVLSQKSPWRWPAGARPRDLLADVARATDVAVEGVDALPHDHLPALSLPEMTLAERIDLLLAPFDLRVDWQAATGTPAHAATGRIIAIDAELPPTADAGPSSDAATPPAGKGRPAAPGRPKPAKGIPTFSLRVAAPLEELLTAIATRLELRIDLDRESLVRRGIAPGEIVRATVKDASRDELLDAVLAPLDLSWTINGDTLRVFAR